MKKLIPSLCITAALIFGTAFPQTASARDERHPEIREAIHALERAKQHMQEARHDFGGHRAEALEACDRAIHELQRALDSGK